MRDLSGTNIIDIFRQNWLIPCILSMGLLLLLVRQSVEAYQNVQQSRAIPTLTTPHPAKISTLPNIAQWHLFGRYATDYSHLPITHLPLTLQGTLLNTQSVRNAGAIIANADGQAKLYHIGQQVPGDAKIQEIQNTQVILKNHGRLESLRLPIQHLQLSSAQP